MPATMGKLSAQKASDLPYRIRDVAMDVGLLMVAAVFILLGGTGLAGQLADIAYPLSGVMVTDAALTGFLAGLCLLGWLLQRRWLTYLAAGPLVLITLYTLAHNRLAGGPWVETSWVSGGPRILSAAAVLLFLVALCTTLGMQRAWQRLLWAGSGLLAFGAGVFSLLMLLLPANRLVWAEGFVSAPILATLYALLGGLAFVGAAWRGARGLLPLGLLTQLTVVCGVLVSCLAWYTLSWSAQSHMQRQATSVLESGAQVYFPHAPYLALWRPGSAIDDITFNGYANTASDMLRAGVMPAGFAITGLIFSYLLALSLGLVKLVLLRSRELLAARNQLEMQYDLEQRYRSLYLYHPDGVLSVDRDGLVVTANEACTQITGLTSDEMEGSHFSTLLQRPDIPRMQALYTGTLGGQPHRVELQIRHREGHLKSLDLTTMPIIVGGETQGVFAIVKDITQQHEQAAQLAYQASHDLLTGLPNLTAFEDCLNEVFEASQQSGRLLVVMHLDLDGFKTVNEGLGHHVGDELLVAVAERLRRITGRHDTLVRLTGDEFALLLTALDDRQAGIAAAEKILNALLAPFLIGGHSVHISASIGITSNSETVEHPHELMQQADIAMGEAKQQGRNTWQWYQGDVQRLTRESVLLRHDLHAALLEDQFELYYQPIVEAVSGQIRGFEALIRWHHPERGMIAPGVFIPLAEQTGQIIPLGRWILHRVCQDVAFMQTTQRIAVPVAVNISSLQFRRAGFLDDMQQALDASGIAPEWLEVEVTESVLLDGAEQAIELINRLKTMGIKVALDDFGTGFSSLSYLRDLPIHKVKLDRAFIKDITTDTRNAAIVQGIITMAHHLNLTVVAEGIEVHDQQ